MGTPALASPTVLFIARPADFRRPFSFAGPFIPQTDLRPWN
jgi:hypothetical protein